MPSTYTANGGIELIATGEQSGTWGSTTNTNLQIIDRLTNGVGAISLSGTTHTLTTTDGVLSDGQFAVLVFGGSPSGTNTVTISPNDADHVYIVKNNSGQSVVLTQGSGGNVTVANGKSAIVYSDGAGAGAAVVDITSTFVPAGALLAANNLSDVADAPTALSNLGITATAAELNILDGVTATTAELNILDGATVTTAELNILDGVTATAAELNILDGVTATTAELNILDGVTATAAELNYVDIAALGTSEASKAVTADANGDVLLSEELTAKSYNETFVAVTSTSNAATVNCEAGNNFSHTLTENTTFTFSNPPATGTAYGFTLKIVQDAGASGFTVTWPASVDYAGATAPTLTDTANAVDVFVFYTHDGGTNWYGFIAGQNMGTPA
jgi:hypothetical protein